MHCQRLAAAEPVFIPQPQNPDYQEYDLAAYSVVVSGENLRTAWYLRFNGEICNLLDTSGGMQPWEYYACMVATANDGSAYSSVVPVTGMETGPTVEPPVILTDKLADGIVGEAYSTKLNPLIPRQSLVCTITPVA